MIDKVGEGRELIIQINPWEIQILTLSDIYLFKTVINVLNKVKNLYSAKNENIGI